ncbi:hypothetical protein [Peribacillus simplex]
MNYSGLQEFIKKYDKDDDFTGGVSEEKVKETENNYKSHFRRATNGF